ncbi:hypothetical protein D3C71_1622870 [compost metagenome]
MQIDVLAQLPPVYTQVPITAAQPRLGQLLGARHTLDPRLRTEAPQIEQRLEGRIESTAAFLSQLQPHAYYFEHPRGNRHATACRRPVERRDHRIVAVGGHLPIDFGQNRLGLGLEGQRIGDTLSGDIFDRVGAAHGRAAELFDLLRMQTAR